MVMQKNWYAVYTKPQAEKRVAGLLAKKKIETFVPMGYVKTKTFMKHKFVLEPLLKSVVFVYTSEEATALLKQTNGVINLLYWLGKPAVIATEEIDAIREFTETYRNIKLEPASVNCEDTAEENNGFRFSMKGRLYAMKNKTIKINLPSLGYALIAEIEEDNLFISNNPLLQNYRLAHSS